MPIPSSFTIPTSITIPASITIPPSPSFVTARVTVDASRTIATIPSAPGPYGLHCLVYDQYALHASTPGLLAPLGLSLLRWPGGFIADYLQWKGDNAANNATHPYLTQGYSTFIASGDDFYGFLTQIVGNVSGANALAIVNYGTGPAAGAGVASYAADMVEYANGSSGTTQGAIRAARGHSAPFGVAYWEIGSEQYNAPGAWAGSLGTQANGWGAGNTTGDKYATNAATFIAAMKAKDPTIKCGLSLFVDAYSVSAWNSSLLQQLQAAGTSVDFFTLHYYPLGSGSETDAKAVVQTQPIRDVMRQVKQEIAEFNPANAGAQLLITESNVAQPNPGKPTTSMTGALFAADNVLTWLEQGAANVIWHALRLGIDTPGGGNYSSSLIGADNWGNFGILSSGLTDSGRGLTEPALNTPYPTYYALQLLPLFATGGDALVSGVDGSTAGLRLHAAKRASDGKLAILFINRDPTLQQQVVVTIKGYSPAGSGTQYQITSSGAGITQTAIASGLASGYTQVCPPYSLTLVIYN